MAWFAANPTALQAASTLAQANSSYQQGQDAKRAASFNAASADAERKAELDQAARQEESLRRENSQFLGKQRAAIAESGSGSGGSNGLLADQSAVLAELDALNVRYAGAMRGTGLLSQAQQYRMSGRASSRAGGMLAGAQILAGASDTYKTYRLSTQS